jgi:Lipid A 3-O-deacylase (PagL)
MMTLRNYFSFLVLCFSTLNTFAQTHVQDSIELKKPNPNWLGKGLLLEFNTQIGSIYKHTVNFHPEYKGINHISEISIYQQTFGAKAWHAKFHYPLIGATFQYTQLSNERDLGQVVAAYATLRLPIYRTNRTDCYLDLSNGLAYFTKKYDAVNNSINNVIGSNVNEITHLKLLLDCKLTRFSKLQLMGSFYHYSNARYASPNLGINLFTAGLGFQCFVTRMPANFRPVLPIKRLQKIQKNIQIGYARNEFQVAGGPRLSYFTLSTGLSRNVGYCHRLSAGLWYEYYKGGRRIYDYNFTDAGDGWAQASRIATVFGEELLMGRFGISAQVGLYLYQGVFKQLASFQQLGVNYTLIQFSKIRQQQLYIGTHLKSHSITAEYFDTTIGLRF